MKTKVKTKMKTKMKTKVKMQRQANAKQDKCQKPNAKAKAKYQTPMQRQGNANAKQNKLNVKTQARTHLPGGGVNEFRASVSKEHSQLRFDWHQSNDRRLDKIRCGGHIDNRPRRSFKWQHWCRWCLEQQLTSLVLLATRNKKQETRKSATTKQNKAVR